MKINGVTFEVVNGGGMLVLRQLDEAGKSVEGLVMTPGEAKELGRELMLQGMRVENAPQPVFKVGQVVRRLHTASYHKVNEVECGNTGKWQYGLRNYSDSLRFTESELAPLTPIEKGE